MKGVLDEVHGWLSEGDRVALARVVEVIGSGVRPAGAAIAVTGGEVVGSASGGCVEGALVDEARAALADDGRPRLRTFGCTDDEAFDVGLTCGGVIRVLIERFEPGQARELSWLDQLLSKGRSGQGAALVEVIDGPEHLLGWKAIVPGDAMAGPGRGDAAAPGSATPAEPSAVPGSTAGGMPGFLAYELLEFPLDGGGAPDAVVRDALADLAAERSAAHSYHVRHQGQESEVTVFVDTFPAPPEMVIIGAASFTAALSAQAKLLGYHVVVCDPRPVFASPARFPEADEVVAAWPDRYLDKVGPTLTPRDALCVLTHDPKFDLPAIVGALRTQVGYIGVMGSRRTQEDRKRRLREAGVAEADLERLHGPIGLDLGANSPEETAVSIVGEIIALRNGRTGGALASASGPIHPVAPEVSPFPLA